MPVVGQLGRGGCFGVLAVVDLRLRSSSRNVERERDEEFHQLLLPGAVYQFRHGPHWSGDVHGGYAFAHRRFDDGNVLLDTSATDSDAGDHLAVAAAWHAAANCRMS